MPRQGTDASATPPERGGTDAEELAYRLRQQLLTAEYGRFALKTHDGGALLQETARVCALGLKSALCKVMEYLPEEHQFIVRAGVGWRPGTVGQARVGADTESPTGYTFQTGQPVISNHLESEQRFRTPTLLVEHGVKRAINVLIQGDSERFGVLEVDSPTEGRFTEADLAFMQGFANLLGVAIERQRVEEALLASQARLDRSLAHQEVLTREINHRVKNSLTLVASLLRMQGRTSINQNLTSALEDAEARVRTIAQRHDRLWRAHEVYTLDLAEFMGEVCECLAGSAGPGQILSHESTPVTVATDQAVPLGLPVNELVTNAFKYAYPGSGGEVGVTVRAAEGGKIRVEVCDRGVGLPPDFDAASTSLGIRLITALGRQLRGTAEWQDAQPGTRYVLDFVPQQAPRYSREAPMHPRRRSGGVLRHQGTWRTYAG